MTGTIATVGSGEGVGWGVGDGEGDADGSADAGAASGLALMLGAADGEVPHPAMDATSATRRASAGVELDRRLYGMRWIVADTTNRVVPARSVAHRPR